MHMQDQVCNLELAKRLTDDDILRISIKHGYFDISLRWRFGRLHKQMQNLINKKLMRPLCRHKKVYRYVPYDSKATVDKFKNTICSDGKFFNGLGKLY